METKTLPTHEQQISIIRATFEALAKSKNESGFHKMPLDVQDVTNSEGVKIGVRLVSAIEPTAQYLFVPSNCEFVAGFTFPGDDAAYSVGLALEVANAVRSAFPSMPTNLVSVLAPVYSEQGVSFTQDGEEVYNIFREFTVKRAEYIQKEKTQSAEADLSAVASQ